MSTTGQIELLVADGIVDEIVQQVKTGKEAEVYVVRKGADYLAAKVYKERTQRNFKNNVGYMEGRSVRNSRDMRAMAKRTRYGVDKAETEWMQTEHDALVTASHAGVRVPKPELFYEGVLLMELVLGADGQPAPRIVELPLTPEEALAHHREMVGMIVRLLCCDLIHADLSAYNVLMAWNGPTIIDLPQVIKAAHNSQAEQFLVRDVRNITDHFARYAPELKRRLHDGHAIWRKYMRRELSVDYFPEEGEARPPRNDASRTEGVRRDGPRRDGPRNDGPRNDGPRRDFAPRDGAQQAGQRPDVPRREMPRREGPRRDGPQQGPQRDSQMGGPRPEQPRHHDRPPQDRRPNDRFSVDQRPREDRRPAVDQRPREERRPAAAEGERRAVPVDPRPRRDAVPVVRVSLPRGREGRPTGARRPR